MQWTNKKIKCKHVSFQMPTSVSECGICFKTIILQKINSTLLEGHYFFRAHASTIACFIIMKSENVACVSFSLPDTRKFKAKIVFINLIKIWQGIISLYVFIVFNWKVNSSSFWLIKVLKPSGCALSIRVAK